MGRSTSIQTTTMRKTTSSVLITAWLGSVISVPVKLSEEESRLSLSPKKVLADSVQSISNNVFVSLVRSESPSSNVIISPVSIHFALSLLYHGAEGRTREQLSQFMKFVQYLIQRSWTQLLFQSSKLDSVQQ